MTKNDAFDRYIASYEAWFDQHPYVFASELAAIRKIWPRSNDLCSLEIATGTGRLAKALGIKEGIEPASNMAVVAEARGVKTFRGIAEDLPYTNDQFDVVLMNFCISYLRDPQKALKESFRVLKNGGCLILGFIDKNSRIGKAYESRRPTSIFYKDAHFYSVAEIAERLKSAGFMSLEYSQTLFNNIETTVSVEESIPGYGNGSYVLVKAIKKASTGK
jgi:ubiquinone/menaquinone biosynthesis C-methylase UbiE